MPPWAITREKDDALRVTGELRAAGLEAFALPCIERVARPVTRWLATGHRVAFVTSAGAVEAVSSALRTMPFDDLAAISPATSAALRAIGLEPTIECEHGAVELATETVQRVRERGVRSAAIWYPTSDASGQRREHHEALARLQALGTVSVVVAYETRAPSSLTAEVNALPESYGVVFTSPSTVEHFLAARPPRRPHRVVCWGASTLAVAVRHFPDAIELNRLQPLSESLAALETPHV